MNKLFNVSFIIIFLTRTLEDWKNYYNVAQNKKLEMHYVEKSHTEILNEYLENHVFIPS